jgi:hypothetical protein
MPPMATSIGLEAAADLSFCGGRSGVREVA